MPCVQALTGNFFGDGRQEVLTAVSQPPGNTGDWVLQVGGQHATLHDLLKATAGCAGLEFPAYEYARMLGAAPFAGPGRDLALIQVTSGASTAFGVLVGIWEGRLAVVTVADGAERCQRIFPWGGSVTHQDGLACGSYAGLPVLYVWRWTTGPPDYGHVDWWLARYGWSGPALHLEQLSHSVLPYGDPRASSPGIQMCGVRSTP